MRIHLVLFILMLCVGTVHANSGVRIKDLGRIDGVRDNSIVGYGIMTGLAGTGDSSRSEATLQSVSNMLKDFGVVISADQINSRNVAAVTITATLPPFVRAGDKLDINVSSLGDARSLQGGTLLLTPLYGPDRKVHALAQGQITTGGYTYDLNGNAVQKNHPTAGIIAEGAIVESEVATQVLRDNGEIIILLHNPDYTTANRVATALNRQGEYGVAKSIDAARISLTVPESRRNDLVPLIASIENISVTPEQRAKVVVNERTGTVVAGGDVKISKVTVTHGDLKVSIITDYLVSQPSLLIEPGSSVSTEVVPRTQIDVQESGISTVSLPAGTTVAEFVGALNKIKTSTRDVISILQGIKRAGALHAELIIQ